MFTHCAAAYVIGNMLKITLSSVFFFSAKSWDLCLYVLINNAAFKGNV